MADFKAQTAPLLARLDPPAAAAGAGRARAARHRRRRRALEKTKGTVTFSGALASAIRKVTSPLFLQVENDDPQPQVVVAFGLRMTNCAPSRSSR